MVASMLALDTQFNAGFESSPRSFGMLFFVVGVVLLVLFHRRIAEAFTSGSILRLSLVVAAWGMIAYVSVPYAILVNALTAPGTTVLIEGPVAEKFIDQGKGAERGHIVVLFDAKTHDQARFLVSEANYNAVAIGATYSRCMYQGRFGIPFVWRFSKREPVCSPSHQVAGLPGSAPGADPMGPPIGEEQAMDRPEVAGSNAVNLHIRSS